MFRSCSELKTSVSHHLDDRETVCVHKEPQLFTRCVLSLQDAFRNVQRDTGWHFLAFKAKPPARSITSNSSANMFKDVRLWTAAQMSAAQALIRARPLDPNG